MIKEYLRKYGDTQAIWLGCLFGWCKREKYDKI